MKKLLPFHIVFLVKLKIKKGFQTPFHDIYGMTSKFTGVSEKLVRKICNEKLIMKRRLDVEKDEKSDDA